MARQADHAHVVAEVLPAELRADARPPGELQHLLLQLVVPEPPAQLVAGLGQVVQVAGGRQLGRFDGQLRRRTTDDDGEVVRRAGGGPETADLGVEEPEQAFLVQDRLGLLEQVALVGRSAALGHEQQLVGVSVHRGDLDLRREVGAGVDLLPHRHRCELGVAEMRDAVGLIDAPGDRLLVAAAGEHVLPPLALDDGGPGVLAHRQHAAGGYAGVLEQVEGDETVVGRRLRIVEDVAELLQVAGTEQVRDVAHRLLRQQREDLGLDLHEAALWRVEGGHTVCGQSAVRRVVLADGQQVLVGVVRHAGHGIGPHARTSEPAHPPR